MATLERALTIACEAHKGQVDKANEPYILHVLRVVLGVEGADEQIVAALHDVVEKNPQWTLERIAVESFPPEIVEAVDALTRRPEESEEAFLARATAAVEALVPGCRPAAFGHMGDGNIHFNVSQPVGADKAAFIAGWDAMGTVVHGVVAELDGSISAEHGIGRLKRHLLPGVKAPLELDLMRRIKRAYDPNGILNPNRVL